MKIKIFCLLTAILVTEIVRADPEISNEIPNNNAFINGNTLNHMTDSNWISLFNGESLEGWTVKCLPEDKGKTYWQVTGSAIECNSIGDPDHNYVWLTSLQEFSDFHLRLQFQVFKTSPGNSGVQFRSRYDNTLNGGWLNGPQVDIHPPAPFRTGLIYDETEGVRRWIYPSLPDWQIMKSQAPEPARSTSLVFADEDTGAWNTLEIICEGMHIETFVNGTRVTDFDGKGILNDGIHSLYRVGDNGIIALQLHSGDELRIRFREIYVREL
ncbi:MAG: DUF1080 domain-containing protein [Bacteroidales bacterium]|nr:DUF1080 domain-containing protein [Bacteroidales bacterium]